jgi:phospholipase/carboxylesterase
LLSIGKQLDEHVNFLSIRGNVSENGMNRFFKRLSPGVFDIENLEKETKNLYDFFLQASKEYHFSLEQAIVLGYSNGANIAVNLLFKYPNSIKSAVLMHPMIPQSYDENINFNRLKLFISAGKNDPMVPYQESKELIKMFEKRNAKVSAFFHQDGHQITFAELKEAHNFINKLLLK